jgi:formylglycine-generating enzyme required for sulfatase activity
MASIFISYRREDSAPYAGRLCDRLRTHFEGTHEVFMDIDTLQPGDDFIEAIERIVSSSHVLIVVIGKQWLTIVDEEGRARLENPDDLVRLEIQMALDRKLRVIPALVGGARMPKSHELPQELAALARRNAVEISDLIFHQSVMKLVEGLERALASEPAGVKGTEPPRPLVHQPGATRFNPKDGLFYVWIPPGKFTMGCSPRDEESLPDEKPEHQVILTKGFWISRTPVTQEAFEHLTEKNPSRFNGTNLPVDSVTWDEADAYCRAVGGRLPTEAEWEYAARAGSTSSRYGDIDTIAWYDENSGNKSHQVAQRTKNAWGLYDMLGNVWEWVADCYGPYPNACVTDPRELASSQDRVLRGGSWGNNSRCARASGRGNVVPALRNHTIGFRCALDWELPPLPEFPATATRGA